MSFVGGVGYSNIDLIYSGLDRLPDKGEEIFARGFSMQFGGGIPATMINLSRLGVESRIITFAGHDLFSEFVKKTLNSYPVKTVNLYKGNKMPVVLSSTLLYCGDRSFISYTDGMDLNDAVMDEVYENLKGAYVVDMHVGFLDVYKRLKKDGCIQIFDTGWEDDLTLEKYRDTSLYVLADPPYFKQVDDISSKKISRLFSILRDTFSYVVVDTSGGFDNKAMTALENSDLIFLAAIVNLPAIRNCQRCLELFEKLGFEEDKVQVLINRYMENDEIKAEDVEEVLGKKLYWKIPNNYFTMMSAINKGVPVSDINPDSNVALSYKNLALMVSDSVYRQKLTKKLGRV